MFVNLLEISVDKSSEGKAKAKGYLILAAASRR